MVTCYHCHQQTTESEYARTVHNKTPLYGPWSGWRMAGRFLVAPGRERITPERLRGVLWAEENRARSLSRKAGLQGGVILGWPIPPTGAGEVPP